MDRDRWQDFMRVREAEQARFNSTTDKWLQAAIDLSRSMQNTLFVLNGGAILAIPALRQFFESSGSGGSGWVFSALTFFIGVVFAGFSVTATILNYQLLAASSDEVLSARLSEVEERWQAEGSFAPSEKLQGVLAQADVRYQRGIETTKYLGWVFGILSGICFISGGVTLGGNVNPFCHAIGCLCYTRGM